MNLSLQRSAPITLSGYGFACHSGWIVADERSTEDLLILNDQLEVDRRIQLTSPLVSRLTIDPLIHRIAVGTESFVQLLDVSGQIITTVPCNGDFLRPETQLLPASRLWASVLPTDEPSLMVRDAVDGSLLWNLQLPVSAGLTFVIREMNQGQLCVSWNDGDRGFGAVFVDLASRQITKTLPFYVWNIAGSGRIAVTLREGQMWAVRFGVDWLHEARSLEISARAHVPKSGLFGDGLAILDDQSIVLNDEENNVGIFSLTNSRVAWSRDAARFGKINKIERWSDTEIIIDQGNPGPRSAGTLGIWKIT